MTATTAITIHLYATQAAFVFDTARYPAFIAGRNSGKTLAGAVKAANWCTSPGLGVIAAPSYPMLEHAARRAFLQELDRRAAVDPTWHYQEQRSLRLVMLPATGAEVLFVSLDNPDAARGPNFSWGWLDEGGFVGSDAWRILKGAVRAGDHPQLWITTTPKGRNHWLYTEWVEQPDPEHTLHRAASFANPFIPADYVAALGYAGRFYEQEILGEFVGFAGLVYPQFSRERHARRIDCSGWGTVLGVDVGTRNPTVVLTIRHAGDRRHIERERYERGLGAREIVALIAAEAEATQPEAILVDPSALDVITDLARAGYPARRADNRVADGIRLITSLLGATAQDGSPLLTVDPGCIETIAEFESYAYPPGRDERSPGRDLPLKQSDHAMDALRYACLAGSLGELAPVSGQTWEVLEEWFG
jgi:hypothetical protein